ncbi:MAG: glycosyltransferase [bacterium]|nr:glycosyltransferase [bacterium]
MIAMGKNKQPKVSIIMGVYNVLEKEQLIDAVESMLNQTMQEFEFIIYDDGSDQETIRILEEIVARDSRILLILGEQNRGLGFALNECIRVAKGSYIARMDADDISLPQRLEYQVAFLEKHSEFDWIGCNTYLREKNENWGKRTMTEKPDISQFLKYSPYIHPTVVFRRKLFDEGYFYSTSQNGRRCEDYELFLRLHIAGYHGFNLQQTLFCYREDREAFKKRKFRYRVEEAIIRYSYLRRLDLPCLEKWLGIIRPILVGILPSFFIKWYKRKLGRREYR